MVKAVTGKIKDTWYTFQEGMFVELLYPDTSIYLPALVTWRSHDEMYLIYEGGLPDSPNRAAYERAMQVAKGNYGKAYLRVKVSKSDGQKNTAILRNFAGGANLNNGDQDDTGARYRYHRRIVYEAILRKAEVGRQLLNDVGCSLVCH